MRIANIFYAQNVQKVLNTAVFSSTYIPEKVTELLFQQLKLLSNNNDIKN